jgi:predicted O-methyltransferase YrrM
MDEIMDLLKFIGRGWVDEIRSQLHQALAQQTEQQTDMTNRKFEEIAEKIEKLGQLQQTLDHQTDVTNRKFEEIAKKVDNQSSSTLRRFEELAEQLSQTANSRSMLGERTYDVFHRDEQKLLRASPGKIFNREKPCTNPAFAELLKLATGDEIADGAWDRVVAETLVDVSSVPGAAQVFEGQAYLENYLAELARKFRARYGVGSIELNDALFLYWLVRQTKPRRIVQCGAFNGQASAFMMLALAKNGPDGTLTIIDQSPIFDPEDPSWTVEGKIYGAVLPPGKTSAWMVPDQYRARLQILNGEVNGLLPKVVDDLDAIDLFYYASDHAYQQIMPAFEQAKRKLRQGGLVVAVDVGWNASLWDFAGRYGAPSYTFKGAVGVGFF